jgi:hypothetical protein
MLELLPDIARIIISGKASGPAGPSAAAASSMSRDSRLAAVA